MTCQLLKAESRWWRDGKGEKRHYRHLWEDIISNEAGQTQPNVRENIADAEAPDLELYTTDSSMMDVLNLPSLYVPELETVDSTPHPTSSALGDLNIPITKE